MIVRLTKTSGIPVYVNIDQALYWFQQAAAPEGPFTQLLERPRETWTRIVFAGLADGAALTVTETPEEIAELIQRSTAVEIEL